MVGRCDIFAAEGLGDGYGVFSSSVCTFLLFRFNFIIDLSLYLLRLFDLIFIDPLNDFEEYVDLPLDLLLFVDRIFMDFIDCFEEMVFLVGDSVVGGNSGGRVFLGGSVGEGTGGLEAKTEHEPGSKVEEPG